MVATSALYQQIARQKAGRPPSELLCAFLVLLPILPWLAILWTAIVFMVRMHVETTEYTERLVRVPLPDLWRIDIPAVEALTGGMLVVVPTFLVHRVGIVFTSLLGLFLAVACIGALAYLLRARLSRAELVDDSQYAALTARLNALHVKLAGLRDAYGAHPAYQAVEDLVELSEVRLRTCGPHWAPGSGYSEVGRLLDQAEEALLPIEPTVSVLEGAFHDLLRIHGSTIDDKTEKALQDTILSAVAVLSPRSAAYMEQVVTGQCRVDAAAAAAALPLEAADRPWVSALNDEQRAARIALRGVRHTINKFRDEKRQALGAIQDRARKALFAVAAVLFLIMATAVDFSLLFPPSESTTVIQRSHLAPGLAAVVFYFLVGVLMGFLPQLRDAQRGQATAEVVDAAPLLTLAVSGLAALGGVILVYVASSDFNLLSNVIGSGSNINPFGGERLLAWMVVAAVFGLAPGRLLDGLQRYTGALQRDLQATEASPGSTPKGPTGGAAATGATR